MRHDEPQKDTVLHLSEATFRRLQAERDEQEKALLELMHAATEDAQKQS